MNIATKEKKGVWEKAAHKQLGQIMVNGPAVNARLWSQSNDPTNVPTPGPTNSRQLDILLKSSASPIQKILY